MKKAVNVLFFVFFAFSTSLLAQKTTLSPSTTTIATSSNIEMAVYPSFPQGDATLDKYLSSIVKVPNGERKTGVVIVYFMVDTNGNPEGHRVLKSIGQGDYDVAALEAVKSIERWTPGSTMGKTRKMGHRVEVRF